MDCRKDGIMTPKILGAILVIAGCGGFGAAVASSHRKTELTLRRLSAALDFMECELQYRLTPLPDLCRQAGKQGHGCVHALFHTLGEELERQIAPDVESCIQVALAETKGLPDKTAKILRELGATMGRFDLNGQLKGLEYTRTVCREQLENLGVHREERIRGYQTLGLCAGAAIVILMI